MKLALALASSMLAGSAGAQTVLTATLNNASENPPTVPTTAGGQPRAASFGTASFFIDSAASFMTFTATIFNIDVTGTQTTDTFDNLVAAHIHVGAPPGSNAGVRWGFFGTPDNDINPKQYLLTPFVGSVGGTFTSIWDQPEGNPLAGVPQTLTSSLPQILAGLSYINFHTTQFPGGEVRGAIQPIPEPETYALMLAGLGAVSLVARKRCQKGA